MFRFSGNFLHYFLEPSLQAARRGGPVPASYKCGFPPVPPVGTLQAAKPHLLVQLLHHHHHILVCHLLHHHDADLNDHHPLPLAHTLYSLAPAAKLSNKVSNCNNTIRDGGSTTT